MRLLFVSGVGPISWAIRATTFSRWSHVALLLEDDRVLDSQYGRGVTVRKNDYPAARTEMVWVEVPRPQDAYAFAHAQVGKPYDYSAVLSLPRGGREWDGDDSWFCSELVEAVLAAGGRRRFHEPWRVTPHMSYIAARGRIE